MQWIEKVRGRFGIFGEFLGFLWDEKMWWMIPLAAVLLIIGLLLVVALAMGPAAPFIYTLI